MEFEQSPPETWLECDERYGDIFAEVMHILRDSCTPYGIMVWLNSRNSNLDGRKPIEMINAGEGLRVREVAYQIEEMS